MSPPRGRVRQFFSEYLREWRFWLIVIILGYQFLLNITLTVAVADSVAAVDLQKLTVTDRIFSLLVIPTFVSVASVVQSIFPLFITSLPLKRRFTYAIILSLIVIPLSAAAIINNQYRFELLRMPSLLAGTSLSLLSFYLWPLIRLALDAGVSQDVLPLALVALLPLIAIGLFQFLRLLKDRSDQAIIVAIGLYCSVLVLGVYLATHAGIAVHHLIFRIG